ncbi:MAG: phosphoadenosine phosphosulfate reductase family protein [Streptomyces sp.]|nr:phosphoadenosine phosphosulfate reductase family protein [Streptomyces sp.]
MMTPRELRAWVRGFDALILNSSGGKDSLSALHHTATLAEDAGVLDRLVVLHLDLGHVEWPGAAEIAAAQAAHYGVRFQVRRRDRGGLLDLVRARRRWPSAQARYCTSATKRDVARKFYTQTVRESGITGRPARLLNVLGIRGAESRTRARRSALALDSAASNGRREITTWLPVHGLSTAQVWDTVRASGAPSHPVYRHVSCLSCSLCPLASYTDLIAAARLRPDLAAEYAAIEEEIGHTFQAHRSMAQIIEAADRAEPGPDLDAPLCAAVAVGIGCAR